MQTTPLSFEDAPRQLLTTEAAEALGVSKPTLCRWIRCGYVSTLRALPKRAGWLIAAEEVERVRELRDAGMRFVLVGRDQRTYE